MLGRRAQASTTAAGRTSCPPVGHPAPGGAALPPGAQPCSSPAGWVWGQAGSGAGPGQGGEDRTPAWERLLQANAPFI